jgi:branched-chain amino acid transport system ATP-binding protein
VSLDRTDITSVPPETRARMGLFRTFQGSHSFTELSVFENVEVSALGVGQSRRESRRLASEALAASQLTDLAERPAGSLTTGQERRLQVARALAARPRYLLLDEPAAGLNEDETDHLVEVIKGLPVQLGCGVLLIEHDMRVVMGCCTRIVVLDQGRVIKVGTPAEVRSDKAVIDAYLGS